MQAWITAAIGVGGTIGGAAVGYRGALSISRDERVSAQRDRIRAAFAEFFSQCVVSVAELRDLPANKTPNWLDKAVNELRGEQGAWIARRRAEFRLTGDRYRQLAADLGIALVQLRALPLPSEVRATVDAARDYIERLGQDRSPEVIGEWSDIHARLTRASESLNEDPPKRRWGFGPVRHP